MVKLFVPKHARVIAARGRGHEEETGHTLALQHRKHVCHRVQKTVVAGHQDGPRRKRLAALDRSSKLLRMNDMVVSFEELELLPKCFQLHQVAIEKNVACGMVSGNEA